MIMSQIYHLNTDNQHQMSTKSTNLCLIAFIQIQLTLMYPIDLTLLYTCNK